MNNWLENYAKIVIKEAKEIIEAGKILEKYRERNRRQVNESQRRDG